MTSLVRTQTLFGAAWALPYETSRVLRATAVRWKAPLHRHIADVDSAAAVAAAHMYTIVTGRTVTDTPQGTSTVDLHMLTRILSRAAGQMPPVTEAPDLYVDGNPPRAIARHRDDLSELREWVDSLDDLDPRLVWWTAASDVYPDTDPGAYDLVRHRNWQWASAYLLDQAR